MWNKMASASMFLLLVGVIFVTSVSGQVSVENASCSDSQLDRKSWNLTAFCSATLYGEASNGNCIWNIYRKNDTRFLSSLLSAGKVHPIDDEKFFWNCSLNDHFPYNKGSYDISIQFYLRSVQEIHAFSLTLDSPELEVPCPDYVIEGGSLNCPCRVTNNLKPPPLLSWDDSPDYREGGTIFLSKDIVNRDQNGQRHSCHAKWLSETISKSYTLNVAYGPDPHQVSVEKIQVTQMNGWKDIVLRCTALDVSPEVKFNWNGPCLNTTMSAESSDCTYRLEPNDNGKLVQCTATNTIANISQHASLTLTYTEVVTRETTTYSVYVTTSLAVTTEKDKDGVPILYIAVGAGCGLVAVILCVTVICCIRRRNKDKEGVKFRGGVMRQSIKPTAVAARIFQYPEGDNAAFVADDMEDDVPSNDPVAKQAQSAIYDILKKRQKEVTFAAKSSSDLASAQDQRKEPQKQTAGPTVSAVSATAIRKDSEQETVTRL